VKRTSNEEKVRGGRALRTFKQIMQIEGDKVYCNKTKAETALFS